MKMAIKILLGKVGKTVFNAENQSKVSNKTQDWSKYKRKGNDIEMCFLIKDKQLDIMELHCSSLVSTGWEC